MLRKPLLSVLPGTVSETISTTSTPSTERLTHRLSPSGGHIFSDTHYTHAAAR